MVTIFKNIKDTKSPHYRHIDFVLDRIKSGKSKDVIEKIRSESDKEKRNELKMSLPSICFSGKFKERNLNGLLSHSGFICMDFDDIDNPSEFKKKLRGDEYVYSAFLSPSGNGVKVLVRIPIENHIGSFYALQERYKNLDKACKDIPRVCYESYDPDIYINRESKVFTKQIVKTYESNEILNVLDDIDEIFSRLQKWIESKGEYFTDGNRNNFLCKIAGACNRFGIPKETTRSLLIYHYVNGSSNFKISEFDSVLNSVFSNYSSQHGTAQFEDTQLVTKETKKEVDIMDLTLPPRDTIFLTDVWGDMYSQFQNGITKGGTTYIDDVDEIFRWSKGELTCLHGIGNHGKSTILNQLMLNKSKMEATRWAIFSPEQYPPTFFYNELIQMYVNKSVMKGDYQMSEQEYINGADFVNEHFYYLFPEKNEPTPDYICRRFSEMIHKKKVTGVVIDPFNQLYHDYAMRDDKYLSKILSEFKRFAVMNDIYFVVLAHPRGGLDSDGENYKAPYYTQLSGGMMWANKCDNILCYHRPYYRSNPKSPVCIFGSQKIKKQQLNGKPGIVKMKYDLSKFRFKPISDEMILDNGDLKGEGYGMDDDGFSIIRPVPF